MRLRLQAAGPQQQAINATLARTRLDQRGMRISIEPAVIPDSTSAAAVY